MTAQPNDAREAFEAIFGPDAEHNPTYNAALSHQSSELREARERIAMLEQVVAMLRDGLEFYTPDNWHPTGFEHSETGDRLLEMKCTEGGRVAENALSTADRIANEEGK